MDKKIGMSEIDFVKFGSTDEILERFESLEREYGFDDIYDEVHVTYAEGFDGTLDGIIVEVTLDFMPTIYVNESWEDEVREAMDEIAQYRLQEKACRE
jgi:hypothetical protein